MIHAAGRDRIKPNGASGAPLVRNHRPGAEVTYPGGAQSVIRAALDAAECLWPARTAGIGRVPPLIRPNLSPVDGTEPRISPDFTIRLMAIAIRSIMIRRRP